MANKLGRPTKYRPEMLDKTQFYMDNYTDKQFGEVIPTIAGLSIYLQITQETIHVWCNDGDHPDLSGLVCDLKSKQELVLLTGGLNSKFNASITKLVLNKHKYNEKIEQDINQTNSGEVNITISHVD